MPLLSKWMRNNLRLSKVFILHQRIFLKNVVHPVLDTFEPSVSDPSRKFQELLQRFRTCFRGVDLTGGWMRAAAGFRESATQFIRPS